jgi:hypothetical protein
MTFIVHEAAYENAIQRNIRRNAAKTRFSKWMAMPGGERANDFLNMMGEFDMVGETNALHPVVAASRGEFFDKMRVTAEEFGGLTEGQHKVVIDMIARGEARVAERANARAESLKVDADKSGWIGTVGERRMFDLTVRLVITMEGQYGLSYLHVMNDAEGNVVVYKGTKKLAERGGSVSVKATVKDHDVRDGVRQTKIARPA